MLVLSRKVGEKIWIGESICLQVVRITGGGVRLGIEAPAEIRVVRDEIKEKSTEVEGKDVDQKSTSRSDVDAKDQAVSKDLRFMPISPKR